MKCTRIDATEIIFCAHEEGQGKLHLLDEAAGQLRAGEIAEPRDTIERVLSFFDDELPIHFLHEDEGLFPVVAPLTGTGDVIAELQQEHDAFWEAVVEFKDSLERLDEAPEEERLALAVAAAEAAGRVSELLRNHIYKEDYVLLPEAEHRLTAEQWEQASRLMEEAEDRYLAQRESVASEIMLLRGLE